MKWPFAKAQSNQQPRFNLSLWAGQRDGPHELTFDDDYHSALDHTVGSTWWLRQKVEALEERLTKLEKK